MNGEKVKNKLIFIIIAVLVVLFFGFIQPFKYSFSPYYAKDMTKQPVNIIVFGDMMLDRNVRIIINKIGFDKFFEGIKSLVKGADIAVVNLEGPFTTYPSKTVNLKNKELTFTFDPAHAPKLADLGFDILGLANNHTLNFGKTGLEMTRRYIGSAGMIYYGDPFNTDEISTIITKNGIKIGFVGFHEFYYYNFEKVYAEIARLDNEVDFLIVSPHWGPEYEKNPSQNMQDLAHKFIDLGADAVIGAHPHVVGTTEEYKGKKIYYSLGNFAFDQYFSEETMNGLGVILDVSKKEDNVGVEYREVKVRVDREGVRISR